MIKITIEELAKMTDNLELGQKIIFTSEDPDELEYYEVEPVQYNIIWKINAIYEKYYTVFIGRIDGYSTVAKNIYILTHGDVDDDNSRVDGITDFIKEYYDNYMEKNKLDNIYLIID